LSLFKNDRLIDLFIVNKRQNKISKILIENIEKHWNDEIRTICKLVIVKLLQGHKIFFSSLNEEDKLVIYQYENSDYKEEMWSLHFNLKGD
jgi:hypothetical protein